MRIKLPEINMIRVKKRFLFWPRVIENEIVFFDYTYSVEVFAGVVGFEVGGNIFLVSGLMWTEKSSVSKDTYDTYREIKRKYGDVSLVNGELRVRTKQGVVRTSAFENGYNKAFAEMIDALDDLHVEDGDDSVRFV